MKKTLICILTALLVLACALPAFALQANETRVTMGANLTQEERAAVYKSFGIEEGSVKELAVTNAEERAYLEGLVPDQKIGKVALSCAYIKTLGEGEGIKVSTENITYCTGEMYRNALITAGISDAQVRVSAPRPVTGTAALTGVYKAYEDLTGTKLKEKAKQIGAEELVITGDLAEQIGGADAAELVNQLKLILDQTKSMTDEEVRAEIRKISQQMDVQITDDQVNQLLSLCRSLEGLDTKALQEKIEGLQGAVKAANEAGTFFSNLGKAISNFFASVGDFFSNLFGGK